MEYMKAHENDEHPTQNKSKSGFLNDGPMFFIPFPAFVINVPCLFLALVGVCMFVIFSGGLGSWVDLLWGGSGVGGEAVSKADNGLGVESRQ